MVIEDKIDLELKIFCARCHSEAYLGNKQLKMSKIIHLWLCKDCHQLCIDKFVDFKEEFLAPDQNRREEVCKEKGHHIIHHPTFQSCLMCRSVI